MADQTAWHAYVADDTRHIVTDPDQIAALLVDEHGRGTILEDRETEHVLNIQPHDFSILHPLRERLDQELLKCDLHWHLVSLPGPPVTPGRYRALLVDGQWRWEEVEQP